MNHIALTGKKTHEVSDKRSVIEWIRNLSKLSKAEIGRRAGFSVGVLSKFDKRDQVLSEENIDHMLDALGIDLKSDDLRFKKGASIEVVIKEYMPGFPDYQYLFELLEKYIGEPMDVTFVYPLEKQKLEEQYHQRVIPEIPLSQILIKISTKLNIVVKRKSSHNFLTYAMFLREKLSEYGVNIHE